MENYYLMDVKKRKGEVKEIVLKPVKSKNITSLGFTHGVVSEKEANDKIKISGLKFNEKDTIFGKRFIYN